MTEEEQIYALLKSEAVFGSKSVYKVGNENTAVEKLAGDKLLCAVLVDAAGVYLGNLCKACENAFTLKVAKSSFNIILCIMNTN